MKIQFIQTLRECPYNVSAQSNGKRLLYDFRVMLDGEHRATFCARGQHERGYDLATPDKPIFEYIRKQQPDRQRADVVRAETKADFLPIIGQMLKDGLIPTLAKLDEMAAARDAKNRKIQLEAEKEAAEEAQRQRYEQHGPKLAAAAERVVKAFAGLATGTEAAERAVRALATALAKVKGDKPGTMLSRHETKSASKPA